MSHLSLEELELIDEPKYRNYINAVDKALKNFEYTSEWADLIAALGKLNKVLQGHSKFNVIPRQVVIAKRLAQCLHPALPSGVHLKALETYDLIFKLIGAARLSNQLFIYSAGLYPLLAHAAINVRPVLLTLYEVHLIPIAEYLKPGLSGFLNGVLPGLEEGADHFVRTGALLDKICSGVGSSFFYGCLWKCVAENGQIRLPAFTYILGRLDRKVSIEDQVEILGLDVDLMVRALCASLEDFSVLVQRSALEFLLAAFPPHGSRLILEADVVQLLGAAVMALLRRDMSLNRRLFSWLLGSDVQQAHNGLARMASDDSATISDSSAYFHRHSKSILIEALQLILKNGCTGPDLRPYRVLISLLEKPEIGPAILDEILVDVFRALYTSARRNSKGPQHEELVKTANLLFGTLEESYVWSFTARALQKAVQHEAPEGIVRPVGHGPAHFLEMCTLTAFLLDILSVDSTSSDTQAEYLPSLLVQTADLLQASAGELGWPLIGAGIDLCLSILKKILPAHEAEEWSGSWSGAAAAALAVDDVDSEEFHSPPASPPALISSAQHQKQLLELAVVSVQQLLAKLLHPGIFRPSDGGRAGLLDWAKRLLALETVEKAQRKSPSLEELMAGCLADVQPPSADPMESNDPEIFLEVIASPTELTEMLPVLKRSCSLLKELAAFPTYCAAALASHQVISADRTWETLPDWLQLLSLACCYGPDPQLYLTVASTLLDLTALASSMIPTSYWTPDSVHPVKEDQDDEDPKDSLFTVLLLPVISATQLLTLIHRSQVFRLLAGRLWSGVADTEQCAELIHQLHNAVPPPLHGVAEEVIMAGLCRQFRREEETLEEDGAAAEKFAILWHLGRDLEPSKWGSRRIRTFDRCLQLLLDWLSLEPASPQRTSSESWLIQSLLRNDLSRVMDPLLLKLLQPHSARVSIRHVTFCKGSEGGQRSDEGELEDRREENDIYAISSVDGQVIYHVGRNDKSSKSAVPVRRSVLMLGEVIGKRTGAVESFVDRQVLFPWQMPQHQLEEESVGLFVNPFPEDFLLHPFKTPPPPVPSFGEDADPPPDSDSESLVIVRSLLDELIDTAVNKSLAAAAAARAGSLPSRAPSAESKIPAVHPLHNHLLLYCQVSDARMTLHVLRTIRAALSAQPRLLLLSLASTGLASSRSPHSSLIHELLARHRKCLFGQGFHGQVTAEWMAPHRSSMYLEILIQLLLYHARSFYSSLGLRSLTREEVMANRQVQLSCVQLLVQLVKELLPLVRDSGKGFASFLSDLLTRCRLQKVALHSVLALLEVLVPKPNRPQRLSLTEEIVLFNEEDEKIHNRWTYSQAILMAFVKLIISVMALEDQLTKQNGWSTSEQATTAANQYQRGVPVHAQPLFTTAILTALKQKPARWIHTEFTRLLAAGLPFMGRSLPAILAGVVPQICLNLESFVLSTSGPPDYLVTELEALTALCHYVLVDSSSLSTNPALAGSAGLISWGVSSNGIGAGMSSTSNGHQMILHNLVHAFTPSGLGGNHSGDPSSSEGSDPYATARRQMLSNLPRILSCIGYLWQQSGAAPEGSNTGRSGPHPWRQKLLEFVSPIGHHHGVSLLAAVSVAWVEKRRDPCRNNNNSRIIPECGAEQLALVDLISSVRVLPPDTLVQLLRQVLKQPLLVPAQNRSWRMEVGLLHFFHAYLGKMNRTQLGECWGSLLNLLRDITSLNAPPVLFAGLVVFGEAVQRYQTPGEKRDQRELQDVTAKLLEACGTVAAACLEQTTWLRRNLSVRRDLTGFGSANETGQEDQKVAPAILNDQTSSSGEELESSGTVQQVSVNLSSTSRTSRYSVQALAVLAELLAPIQDLVFPSQDKDRVIPLLTSLLANVFPYVKHHSQSNVMGMRASSQLLASLSHFPATRRAWRRDILDLLLLDPQFFSVDLETLRNWRHVVDNLMSHDKDAFREFLGRVSASSPSGLFSSRELEMETRTGLLKRLAFALYCTDGDQYQRHLPDIQEKLSENLRLSQTWGWPSVQAQVFLCFRVLLLRTGQQHVTSLWPSVVAELVQVLSQLEHELRRDSEEFSSQIRRLGALDSSWVTNSANGLQNYTNPAWMQLYLSTCKLLHLALALPATRLPQFQMYRWAFVGDDKSSADDGDISTSNRSIQQQVTPNFVPYLTRIYRLLRGKIQPESSKTNHSPAKKDLRLEDPNILPGPGEVRSLTDLMPFFQAVEDRAGGSLSYGDPAAVVSAMENLLERDFLESIPST